MQWSGVWLPTFKVARVFLCADEWSYSCLLWYPAAAVAIFPGVFRDKGLSVRKMWGFGCCARLPIHKVNVKSSSSVEKKKILLFWIFRIKMTKLNKGRYCSWRRWPLWRRHRPLSWLRSLRCAAWRQPLSIGLGRGEPAWKKVNVK